MYKTGEKAPVTSNYKFIKHFDGTTRCTNEEQVIPLSKDEVFFPHIVPAIKVVIGKRNNPERRTIMAKTKSSVRGEQQKKIVPVKPYKKDDGTKVKAHRRSTPN